MSKATQSDSSALPRQFQSATQWLALLRERSIGAVELLELHLKQIEKHNGKLNLVVAQDIEGALQAARQADSRPRSELPPLHGLPMTVKDTLEATGMPATCGFPFLAEHQPRQDADSVARLKAAGAIVFGKTNVPSGAFDWQSYNTLYGTSNNPWDTTRSPGGSSGGPAGAIAAGFSPLELGSDLGGSIRVPAHFCGVYGHKPSYGIVPARGHIPPMPGNYTTYEMAVLGPMARSAQDLELALDVLASPAELSRPAWRVAIPPSRKERLQDFKVAVWADARTYAVDSRCLEAIQRYAQDLRRLGVTVDEKARPEIDWQAAYETYLATLLPMMGSGLPPEAVQQLIKSGAGQPPTSYLARAARALTMPYYGYLGVISEQRERLFRSWRDFFTGYDLLICPNSPTVAYAHDHRGDGASDPITVCEARSTIVDGSPRPYFDGLQWPSLAVCANLPATAVPTGRFVENMPLGVQLIGPFLEDRTPMRFAQLVERELGGFAPPPHCL
ncbi:MULTISPECIES: amidase [unclassified Bradyrhizobium]|uniref:amidase n=1 Tax=unclassified Bradyrhizobium TaxID=2631580 RepID=UPI001FF82B4F|nr:MULTISPECIES: amidase [unclassified Bradyrhizobium]MCK1297387.1 amidase [Bradyrhizobium sp. 37]MCK1769115.1 amidase [Bradyrhizobium sp. 134]